MGLEYSQTGEGITGVESGSHHEIIKKKHGISKNSPWFSGILISNEIHMNLWLTRTYRMAKCPLIYNSKSSMLLKYFLLFPYVLCDIGETIWYHYSKSATHYNFCYRCVALKEIKEIRLFQPKTFKDLDCHLRQVNDICAITWRLELNGYN